MRLIIIALAIALTGILAYSELSRMPRPVFTAENLAQLDQAVQLPPPPPEVQFDPAELAEAKRNPDPRGIQYFAVGGTGKTGPRFVEGLIDPLYAEPGDRQTLRIKVLDSASVGEVSAEIATDSGSRTYPLVREKGTDLAAIWSGSWDFTDTAYENYVITLRATSARGTTKVDISL